MKIAQNCSTMWMLALSLTLLAGQATAEVTFKSFKTQIDKSVVVAFSSKNMTLSAIRIDLMDHPQAQETTMGKDIVEVHALKDGFYTIVFQENGQPGSQIFFVEADNNFQPVNKVAIVGPQQGALAELDLVLQRLMTQESWDRSTAIYSLANYVNQSQKRDLSILKAELDSGLKISALNAQILQEQALKKAEAEKVKQAEAKAKAADKRRRQREAEARERRRRARQPDYPAYNPWGWGY